MKRSFLFSILFLSTLLSHAGVRSLYEPTALSPNQFVIADPCKIDSIPLTVMIVPQYMLPLYYGYETEENRTLYFSPHTTTFVRDAEYFLPYTKGYTALGFIFEPSFLYKINEKASIRAGIHLMAFAGDHKTIRNISPILSLTFQPVRWLTLTGGTLGSGIYHDLYEPMYDYDRFFYDNQEMGLSARTNTKYWDSDMWCNWEDFIIPGSDFQERFTFGWRNDFHAPEIANKVQINIPFHLMMNHRGGQIDAVEDTCIETLMNVATGINADITIKDKVIITPDIPFFFFSNRSNEEHIHTHYQNGYGIYPQVCIQNTGVKHHWKVNAGYWYGNKFISGRGSYLFQSRSYFDEAFERQYRHLITGKVSYIYHYKKFSFGGEFQLYYDTDEASTDISAGIYMRFEQLFKIHTFKEKEKEKIGFLGL